MTGSGQPPFQVLERSRPFHGHVIDQAGAVLLVDQWRHAIGGRLIEIPAGKYDVSGEYVEDALRRELAEELRVEGGTLTWLTTFYTTPGWSDEVVDLFLAEGVHPIDGDGPEADWEEAGMEVVRLSYEEALTLASARPPGDSKTLVALGLYGLRRAGLWSPDPSSEPPPDAPRRRAESRPSADERGSGPRPPVP